jgi:hypothetical protein
MADDLSSLWGNFSLADEEDGELEIQKTEVIEVLKRGQHCVIGKLLSDRIVSKETVKDKFLRWWKLSGSFTFKILGGNLFLVEFETISDKARVLEGGPWDFEGSLFLVEDFDGRTSPSEFTFDRASFWVRMTNLPLACMGREVGFKLGAAAGLVEDVDTDKDGIGWGECLRVKIKIDLYKPLVRGRMLKFDGKSTLIGFKYERLPKFCYHCGVICHGIEGCLKRSMKRNEEILQFGSWLRANSPTRRTEKNHEGHAGSSDSTRYPKPAQEGRMKHHGYPDRADRGRKRRNATSGEESGVGEESLGRQRTKSKDGEGELSGVNWGRKKDTFQVRPQLEKEDNYVGVMREHFENQPAQFKKEWKMSKEGKITGDINAGAGRGISMMGTTQLSPSGLRQVEREKKVESPTKQHVMQQGGVFKNPGGPFSGPVLAEVERSIMGAKRDSMATKRKKRDEVPEPSDAAESHGSCWKKKPNGEIAETGTAKKGRMEDEDNDDGSGMAAAGVQPRRPQ